MHPCSPAKLQRRAECDQARQQRLKLAKIPEKLVLDTFPFDRQPKLNKKKILALYDSMAFLKDKQNILWMGGTGIGKTGLATSFLIQAIHQGARGRYVLFADLLHELHRSQADRSQARVIRRYLQYDLLLIDEIGYVEAEPAQVGLFFTLLQKRHGQRSTLITSNLGFSEWASFLKINWNQGGGGGGAIDLVMHLQQLGFGQALQWLEDRFAIWLPVEPASPTTRALKLPSPVAHHWPRIERYLIEERKLPRSLLTPLVQAGIIYADARANAVFLLGDTPATAIGAELRGTTSQPWRGMAPGSRKDRGFFSISTASVQAIVLCESAIDALSCHVLHPTYRCLSTSGARPDPVWLGALLSLGLPVFCGFDDDPTCHAMAQHDPASSLRPPTSSSGQGLERLPSPSILLSSHPPHVRPVRRCPLH